MTSLASQNHRPFNDDFNRGNRQHSAAVREGTWNAPMLSNSSLLMNPWPKPTGVLEHCREGETNCWLSIFGAFLSSLTPKATKDVNVH